MRKTYELGKINYTGSGKRYAVTIEMETRKRGGEKIFRYVDSDGKPVGYNSGKRVYTGETTPEYVELSICGNIWNTARTDIVCGGQCLDTIAHYSKDFTPSNRETFRKLYSAWKRYHLNGMHAGTPEQEAAIKEWEERGNKYDYEAVCEMLKEKGLYEVCFKGLTVGRAYNYEPYKYGHGWVIETIPADELKAIEAI